MTIITDISNENTLKEMMQKTTISTFACNTTGILQPILQNKWRIIFDSLLFGHNVSILTMQAVKCDFDFVNRLLNVTFEQSVCGDEHVELLGLCSRSNPPHNHGRFTVRVDMLNGNDVILHSMVCLMSRVKSHKFELDYSASQIAKHELVIKFNDLQIMEPKKETQS